MGQEQETIFKSDTNNQSNTHFYIIVTQTAVFKQLINYFSRKL